MESPDGVSRWSDDRGYQVVLWVQFPAGAGSRHSKDVKNGSGPCLHGTQDEVGTRKHN